MMASKPIPLPSGSWNTKVRLPNGKRKSITDPLQRAGFAVAERCDLVPTQFAAVATRHKLRVQVLRHAARSGCFAGASPTSARMSSNVTRARRKASTATNAR